jgi:ribosomal protein L12E/L44/L45/RPP1/RPP2
MVGETAGSQEEVAHETKLDLKDKSHHPTKKDAEDLLETVDITADPENLSSLFAALGGKDVMEVYPFAC